MFHGGDRQNGCADQVASWLIFQAESVGPCTYDVRVSGGMGFDDIIRLRANSRAWRLLRADSAPLVLSFLHRVFVEENVRAIPATELASRLDDQLYALNEREPRSFPRSAGEYLDEWATPESGWLRKYYPEGSDEPHYDATPAVERALQCTVDRPRRERWPDNGRSRSSR